MALLNVLSIQRGCVYDGPGIRTTVFFKGCVLNCPWCCNPESISLEKQFFVDEEKCLKNRGIVSFICKDCIKNDGVNALEDCPLGISIPVSRLYSIDEIIDEIMKDISLFNSSGGGVTLSGGEPLLHSKQLLPLIGYLKEKCSIYLETTLLPDNIESKELLNLCSGVIIDLKFQRGNKLQNKKYYIDTLKKNIRTLTENKIDVIYRLVFVDSVYEDRTIIIGLLKEIAVDKLELLMCHNLAQKKYKKLGMKNVDFTPKRDKFDSFVSYLTDSGIESIILNV